MALIHCPECGEMLSDTAPVCPHCGFVVHKCKTCGAVLPADAKVCPNCGRPVMQAETATTPNAVPAEPKKCGASSSRVWGILFCALLLFLFISNPKERKHEMVVNKIVTEAIEEVADSLGQGSDWANLGGKVAGSLAQNIVNYKFSVKSYLICSVGKVQYNNEEHIVTFGIADHVFCFFSKEDVKKIVVKWMEVQQNDWDSFIPDLMKNLGGSILKSVFGSNEKEE